MIDYDVPMDDDYSVGIPSVSVLIACSDARKYNRTTTSVVLTNGASSAATNGGNVSTSPLVRIFGPCTNPTILNQTASLTLAFTIVLGSSERLDVDTNAGTALIGSVDYMHALAALSVPPEDWVLIKGVNIVSYSASSGGANGVELQYQAAYLA